MAIHNKRFTQTGTSVSRDLPAGERSYDSLVYQSGKPVLDSELNLSPDVLAYAERLFRSVHHPSGFIRPQTAYDSILDYQFVKPGDEDFVENAFLLKKQIANVAGRPVVVEYTAIDKEINRIILEDAPIKGGVNPDVKRTDFVFLEVWLAQVTSSPTAQGWIQINAVDEDGNHALVNGDQIELSNANGDVFLLEAGTDFFIEADDGLGGTTPFNVNEVAASLQAAIDAQVGFDASGTADIVYIRSTETGLVGNDCFYTITTADPTALTPHTPPVAGKSQFAGGADRPNKPDQDHLYRHGNTQSSLAVALDDDIRDLAVGAESTQRVQVQYRIRTTGSTEAVNHKIECDGFSSSNVFAQGSTDAPVSNYRFIWADGESEDPAGPSSALAYKRKDSGLWVAGDGSEQSATDLGSVDGFVYGIPICFVFRRNNAYVNGSGEEGRGAGFNPRFNTNGALPWNHDGLERAGGGNVIMGSVPAGHSDRPDGAFSDVIEDWDILDLRKHSLPTGADLSAELKRQIQHLLDGQFHTWAIDATSRNVLGTNSGDVSTQYLACNEIGRQKDHGADNEYSGETGFGEFIRSFDHIARRFGDQPVVERLVVEFFCDDGYDANHGKYVVKQDGTKKWFEGDVLHLDLESLNATTLQDWSDPQYEPLSEDANVADFMPPGTMITDVICAWHDDGNFNAAVDQKVQIKTVQGVGSKYVEIELDANRQKVNAGGSVLTDYPMVGDVDKGDEGSPRRIFVEFEISYPMGSGLTETPDRKVIPTSETVYPYGELIENRKTADVDGESVPLGRPLEMEKPLRPLFREGFREVAVEMVANCGENCVDGADPYTPIVDSLVSTTSTLIRTPRRVWGSKDYEVQIEDKAGTVFTAHQGTDLTDGTEYGSSSRNIRIAEGENFEGAGQTLCTVTYYAQDPISNWGAIDSGYQVSIYYRTNAPQTCGIKESDFHTEGAESGPLPTNLQVEVLSISNEVWTGQVGMGSLELGFPYVAPLDQIPVIKSTLQNDSHPAEWQFCASTVSTVDDFDATTGLLALHPFMPMDKTTNLSLGSLEHPPFADGEFRAVYPFADDESYRPTVLAQSHSGVVRHKVFYPVLARSLQDSRLFRKGELLLIVFSRWGECDDDNTVRFTDSDNRTCAAVYRTKDMLMTVGD